MNFEFVTASRIVFGRGAASQVEGIVRSFGKRAFVITGASAKRGQFLIDALTENGVTCSTFTVPEEPTATLLERATRQRRADNCDVVVSIGGGSVVDAGKAVAALAKNEGDPLDYLEVIGKGRPLENASLPFIAVPTTAGTGAEVTKNAVILSEEHLTKVSLRGPTMLPNVAVVDPDLTLSVSADVTACTGMDALTQVLEPFVSSLANPLTDALCADALGKVGWALERAYHDGADAEARVAMSLVSLFGGLALTNAKLGAVHGLAGPLGGMFAAPHGALCAALVPHVVRANLRALRERQPGSPFLAKYDRAAELLTGHADAVADDAVQVLTALVGTLNIPSLGTLGVKQDAFATIAEKSVGSSSMKGNPVALSKAELTWVLEQAY